jgi:hypothetical protein
MLKKFENIIKRNVSRDSFLWKFCAPAHAAFKRRFVSWSPSLNKIELEITTFCSLACFNCDRSVRQAPTGEYMALEQINKFVKESLDLDWRWEQITILGGEPTLHPQFFEALEIIKKYKDKNPACVVEIATNGFGPKVREVLLKMPDWIKIRNSAKQSNKQNFSSYNVAPIDLEEYRRANFKKGCWILEACGLGLTRYGYYPCGAGASVDRVFGFDIGLKTLSLVNRKILRKQLKQLCCYCGHFKDSFETERVSEGKVSPSWEAAYKASKIKKPELTLY